MRSPSGRSTWDINHDQRKPVTNCAKDPDTKMEFCSNRTAVFPGSCLASDWKGSGNPGDYLGGIARPDRKPDGTVVYLDVAPLARDLLK